MALWSCGTSTRIEADVADSAIREVRRPDSFFLVKCPPIPKAESDKLDQSIDLVVWILEQYGSCSERHNLLVDQL